VALAIVTAWAAGPCSKDSPFRHDRHAGSVVAFLAYVQRFNQPIQQIAVLWTNIQNAIAGGERIFTILDEKPAVVDKPNAKEMPESEAKWNSIRFPMPTKTAFRC